MSFTLTVCANRTGRTREGGKCSKHSWHGKRRGSEIWVGRLALFHTVSYKVVFFEKTLDNSFGGEVGIREHGVDILLYRSEVLFMPLSRMTAKMSSSLIGPIAAIHG